MKTNHILIILITVLFTITISCTDKEKEQYETAIKKAEQLDIHKKYKESAFYYKKALALFPEDTIVQNKLKKLSGKIQEIDSIAKEKTYLDLEQKAIRFYDEENYEEAKKAFLDAYKLKPDNTYLSDYIDEINTVLEQKKEVTSGGAYHIIVGSFLEGSNAVKLQDKLVKKGYAAKIIPRPNDFRAVSIKSYATVKEAFNNLSVATAYSSEAWVLKN